ncbi:MAG: hypothetical protein EXX96DRAFT_538634 [Benjaminiella poitrasii]|nr:MAG: hypothetical protein EXX96DRAFT_538634 [Benjaminiella poitrasii]
MFCIRTVEYAHRTILCYITYALSLFATNLTSSIQPEFNFEECVWLIVVDYFMLCNFLKMLTHKIFFLLKLVAYSDASISSDYKKQTLVTVKSSQRAIAEKAVAIPIDKFRTSITCRHCHEPLENMLNERRAILKRLDEDGAILNRASECDEAQTDAIIFNFFMAPSGNE